VTIGKATVSCSCLIFVVKGSQAIPPTTTVKLRPFGACCFIWIFKYWRIPQGLQELTYPRSYYSNITPEDSSKMKTPSTKTSVRKMPEPRVTPCTLSSKAVAKQTKTSSRAASNASHPCLTVNQATGTRLDFRAGKIPIGLSAPVPLKHGGVAESTTLKGILGLSTRKVGLLSTLMADAAPAPKFMVSAKRSAGRQDVSGGDSTAINNYTSLPASPFKRRRVSSLITTRSPSKATASSHRTISGGSVDHNCQDVKADKQTNKALHRLAMQGPAQFLDLLWEESWLTNSALHSSRVKNAAVPVQAPRAPPQPQIPEIRAEIPATVSETFDVRIHEDSTSTAATTSSDAQCEDINKEESFGWFVAMDEDNDDQDRDVCMHDCHRQFSGEHGIAFGNNEDNSLAYSAPTAPYVLDLDAQVEWARAADTVDDVLGDLF